MSYDIHLLRPEDAADVEAWFARQEELEEREPTGDELRELRAIAVELQEVDPGLDVHEGPPGVLQLGYDNERPVVVDLAPGEMTLMFSYGADEARAAEATQLVARYLPVFERRGYVAYDPQLEGPFDGGRALEVFRDVQAKVFGELRRPWWRRLFG